MKSLGFIGVGNMSSALLQGMSGSVKMERVLAYGHHPEKMQELADELGFGIAASIEELAASCEYIVIGVQPFRIDGVLEEVAHGMKQAQQSGAQPVLCSIAAGYSIEDFEKSLKKFGIEAPVVRIMPNSGVKIGKGVCLFAPGQGVSNARLDALLELFGGTGLCERVEEAVLDRATPISGCGPAYVYIFIESLADAGVELGIERGLAMRVAEQMVYGTAAYALESGEHVAKLRDELATPQGMTFTSTNHMEQLGFRSAVIGGVLRAYEQMNNVK